MNQDPELAAMIWTIVFWGTPQSIELHLQWSTCEWNCRGFDADIWSLLQPYHTIANQQDMQMQEKWQETSPALPPCWERAPER